LDALLSGGRGLQAVDAASPADPVDDEQLRFVASTTACLDFRCDIRFGGVGIIVSRSLNGGLYGNGEPGIPDGWLLKTLAVDAPQSRAYQPVCPTTLGLAMSIYCNDRKILTWRISIVARSAGRRPSPRRHAGQKRRAGNLVK
jgi:hypothetical protein